MENRLCPLCESVSTPAMTMPLDAKTFEATEHGHIYECPTCSFRVVYPRPTNTESFYELDRYYTQGASLMVDMPETAFLTRLRAHLAWRFDRGETIADVIDAELPHKGEIVDIGCGGGGLIRDLSGRGFRMTGVERDARSLSALNMNVLEGSAERLPALPPGSFDGVVFSHVIEHLVDPLAALRDAARLLKPGGKMFCEVPNNESRIAHQSRLSWEHLDIPRHINFFGEASLRRLVVKAGLSVCRAYHSGYCRYFSNTYIATEQKIHDKLAAVGATDSTRNSQRRAWGLLARTALAPAGQKYDSVGLVAVNRA